MGRRSLFDISKDLREAMENMEQHYMENDTDEVPEEVFEKLNINGDEMADKLQAYFFYMQELGSDVESLKSHIKTMQQKVKKLESVQDKLKDYVGVAVEEFGSENKSGNKFFETPMFKVTIKRSSDTRIDDEEKIPSTFIKKKEVVSIDKASIRKLLMAGEEVPGASLDISRYLVNFR